MYASYLHPNVVKQIDCLQHYYRVSNYPAYTNQEFLHLERYVEIKHNECVHLALEREGLEDLCWRLYNCGDATISLEAIQAEVKALGMKPKRIYDGGGNKYRLTVGDATMHWAARKSRQIWILKAQVERIERVLENIDDFEKLAKSFDKYGHNSVKINSRTWLELRHMSQIAFN